jgi:hypothetical protein
MVHDTLRYGITAIILWYRIPLVSDSRAYPVPLPRRRDVPSLVGKRFEAQHGDVLREGSRALAEALMETTD